MPKPKLSLSLAIGIKDKHKKKDNDYGKVIIADGQPTNGSSVFQKGTKFQEANSELRKSAVEKKAKGGIVEAIRRKMKAKN